MDPQLACGLLENGCTIIVKGAKSGLTLGIDCKSWTIGPKFQGLKMVPPGLHFIHVGGEAGKSGTFVWSSQRQIIELELCGESEQLIKVSSPHSNDEMMTFNVEYLYAMDQFLGPYPLTDKSWENWKRLTSQIKDLNSVKELLSDLCVDSMMGSPKSDLEVPGSSSHRVINFTSFELRKVQLNYPQWFQDRPLTGEDITRLAMDKSALLEAVVKVRFNGDFEHGLLAEFQLSYVILLFSFNYDAFEQWKQLLLLLCQSFDYMLSNIKLSTCFIECLFYQLSLVEAEQVIKELLFDPSTEDNNTFLGQCVCDLEEEWLPHIMANLESGSCLEDSKRLKKRLEAVISLVKSL